MPIRDYECQKCGNKDVHIHRMSEDYPRSIKCDCGGEMDYKWGAPSFRVDFRAGWDDGAGENFDTKRQRDNFLQEKGLRRIRS
mgnify:CR=1 FL=1|jgi:predicted nucleic acid-binding Zn ribbon protein|tara:strand:+ start:3985 stop:4233 length:249 start_codon:yes stop_codon:yes gene_type:complete